MIEIIGSIGAFCLSVCALPQLYKTFKTKNVVSLCPYTLMMWGVGCVCMVVYVGCTTLQLPLLINYVVNSIVVFSTLYLYFKHK